MDTKKWILKINDLFHQMFGGDFLSYTYNKNHGTSISDEVSSSLLDYNHEHWEDLYTKHVINDEVLSDLVDLQGESSTFCNPRPCVEIDALIKKAPNSVFRPVKLCKDTDDFLSDDSLVMGPVSPGIAVDVKEECNPSVCANFDESLNNELLVIEPDSPDVADSKEKCHSALAEAMAKATTRAEIAALYGLLPPVSTACTSATALYPVFSSALDNPFDLAVRPCQSLVDKAQTLFGSEKRKGSNPSGIKIPGMGQFSEKGFAILKKFCAIVDTNCKVSSEADWLAYQKCSSENVAWLQDILWHHSPTTAILTSGKKSIDVSSFSDLVAERYIDSFVIDISIAKFIEEARESGKDDSLYFPSEVYEWLKCSKELKLVKLKKETTKLKNFCNLKLILLPVHMPDHWGLVCIDLSSMKLYFDDGLTSAVPVMVLPAVKELLNLLAEMHPSHLSLQTQFWQECHNFKRFGMPSQVAVDSRMIGTGSCGIGVILAAKYFIEKGSSCIGNFQWRFCDMNVHRTNLMLQILNWAV